MSWHQKYLETLAEGIKYLWNTGHFADATILVGNKRFRCHRAVLAAMSPHFDATFSTGMRDNPDGVLTLLNIDVTTFDSILNFMYTGRSVRGVPASVSLLLLLVVVVMIAVVVMPVVLNGILGDVVAVFSVGRWVVVESWGRGVPFNGIIIIVVAIIVSHHQFLIPVSYTHLRAHETRLNLVFRILL